MKKTAYYDIHVVNPLVNKNQFIHHEKDQSQVCNKDFFLEHTPKLVYPNPLLQACYDYAWNRAYLSLKPANEHFPFPFIDTCFNGHIFMWDSCFMMMYGKYALKGFPFYHTLDDLYAHQHEDGFICREIEQATGLDRFERFDPSSTGPNIFAYTELQRYEITLDMNRLKEVYPVITAYHQWLRMNRTWQDGTYFTSGWGAGMDNIPRADQTYHEEFQHGHLSWIDATAQQALSCKSLIEIAKII